MREMDCVVMKYTLPVCGSFLVIAVTLAGESICLPLARAQQVELAGLEEDFICRSKVEDPRAGSFEENLSAQPTHLGVSVHLPLVLQERTTFLLNSIYWDDTAFYFRNWDYSQEPNYFERLISIRYRLGLRHIASESLAWNAFIEPGMASDAAVWNEGGLSWLAGVKGDFTLSQRQTFGAGVFYLNTFGINGVYPLLSYDWQGERASVFLLPPVLASWRYRLNEQCRAGLSCRMVGNEYYISDDPGGKNWVRYFAVTAGPEVDWQARSGLGFSLSCGMVFMHRLRWYNADENIRNIDFEPSAQVRCGVKYAL